MKRKEYVIIKIGKKYTLKERIAKGFFGAGLFVSTNLQEVQDFAGKNNIEVVSVGDMWEVM